MTDIKPGTPVKVTLYGTYKYGFVVDGEDRCLVLSNDGIGYPLTGNAHVEVLAQPVYINSETTEYRVGDVVRDADASRSQVWQHISARPGERCVWQRVGVGPEQSKVMCNRETLPSRLMLLVRNAQPVIR